MRYPASASDAAYIPAIPERYKNNQQSSLTNKCSGTKVARKIDLEMYKVKCTSKAWQVKLSSSSVSKPCLTSTAKEVNSFLKAKGKEDEYPLFKAVIGMLSNTTFS